jgi:PilZ domain-containing protein
MDRRHDPRFNLNVPVRFMWEIRGTEPQSGKGSTRDVSLRGVFVISDTCPPARSSVRLNMMLSSTDGHADLVMRVRATVVRVESTDDSASLAGFAVATKGYVLERNNVSLNDRHEGWMSLEF